MQADLQEASNSSSSALVATAAKEQPVIPLLAELDCRLLDEAVGSFRIRRRIGQGGMGAVYLAQHATLGTQVAIKVLLPSFEDAAQAERSARRFVEEAKSLATVRHPSLVQIHDAGVLPDGTFLTITTLRNRSEGNGNTKTDSGATIDSIRDGRQRQVDPPQNPA